MDPNVSLITNVTFFNLCQRLGSSFKACVLIIKNTLKHLNVLMFCRSFPRTVWGGDGLGPWRKSLQEGRTPFATLGLHTRSPSHAASLVSTVSAKSSWQHPESAPGA